MKRLRSAVSILCVILSVFYFAISAAASDSRDPCLACHREKTPGIVRIWEGSAHFTRGILCADCHGRDVEANHTRKVTVEAKTCGACHKAALASHQLSRHAVGLKTGKGCTRNLDKVRDGEKTCLFCHKPDSTEPFVNADCAMFLAQSPEMQRRGCSSCHMVEVRCDTCHTRHGTDRVYAKNPEVCGTCHMGPDHPQKEMWESSVHGVLYRAGRTAEAPSCTTCHMAGGSHNVSRGISTNLPAAAATLRRREREFMLDICSSCHTREMAGRNLSDGDAIEKQARALVEEAHAVIADLHSRGLLDTGLAKRPPHPTFGEKFVLGPHMLYENLSRVESLYFRMQLFYYPTTFKGVFHQNPDYAHWYGNAPLKLTLSEIRSEAALLKTVDSLRLRIDNLTAGRADASPLEKALRVLNEKRLRGELTEEEFRAKKMKLLEEQGL